MTKGKSHLRAFPRTYGISFLLKIYAGQISLNSVVFSSGECWLYPKCSEYQTFSNRCNAWFYYFDTILQMQLSYTVFCLTANSIPWCLVQGHHCPICRHGISEFPCSLLFELAGNQTDFSITRASWYVSTEYFDSQQKQSCSKFFHWTLPVAQWCWKYKMKSV